MEYMIRVGEHDIEVADVMDKKEREYAAQKGFIDCCDFHRRWREIEHLSLEINYLLIAGRVTGKAQMLREKTDRLCSLVRVHKAKDS